MVVDVWRVLAYGSDNRVLCRYLDPGTDVGGLILDGCDGHVGRGENRIFGIWCPWI